MVFTFALTFSQFLFPSREFFKPPAKVWSASSSKEFNKEFSSKDTKGYLRLDFIPAPLPINTGALNLIFGSAVMAALIFGLYRLWRDIKSLLKITRRSFLIRRYKSVKIFSSDLIHVPFSFWLPQHHVVVIPNGMLGQMSDMRIAVLHELQHHRQRDTYWVHFLWAMRVLCCCNPAIYFWNKLFLEIQEFACDEALVDQGKVSSNAYASCLVRVAETAINGGESFVCATGLTFMTDRHSLKRRISTMFNIQEKKLGKAMIAMFVLFVVVSLAGVAMASQGLIRDRRVSLNEAREMLTRTKLSGDFHVVVNDLVLKQLNRYIGTPEGREHMRTSLQRMENYKPAIERKLAEYNLPPEFLAVPLVESGYQNSGQNSYGGRAAGLWQFIPQTARAYGLRVDSVIDERLNVDILTDAAMRYLTANKMRFKSVELSLFAYNVGENSVQKAINKTGSRDVWTLIRAGFENDMDYLAKVMAAVLIMKNPSSVQ